MKKRVLTLILAALMIFSVVQCVSAEVYLPDAKGSYSIRYEDSRIVNGETYGFVVVEGLDNAVLDLSDDNLDSILYINQTDAASGAVTFDKFALKGKLPTEDGFVGGTAFIGGKGFSTATTMGTLELPVVPVAAVTLDKTEATIKAGNSIALAATVTPDNATDKTVTWTSSDETVAKVDANGVVTAVKASATAVTITAKAGDKTATCTVTVIAAPGDVDGNDELTSYDALLICRSLAGYEDEEFDERVADVDGSDELTSYDALLICRFLAGYDETLN